MAKWIPSKGEVISVYLPQEIVRGSVIKRVNDDTLVVALDCNPPMGKSHNYRSKQQVTVRRYPGVPTGDRWATEDAA